MAGAETIQARRAALLLHGLSSAGRTRVLASLGASHGARLLPLLDELTALGVSPSLGAQLHSRVLVAGPEDPVLAARERVQRLDAEIVAGSLQSCSAITIATLLRSGAWSWRHRVLELLPSYLRVEVLRSAHCDGPPLAPGALEILCERLCQSAEAIKASTRKNERTLGRWLRWMR